MKKILLLGMLVMTGLYTIPYQESNAVFMTDMFFRAITSPFIFY